LGSALKGRAVKKGKNKWVRKTQGGNPRVRRNVCDKSACQRWSQTAYGLVCFADGGAMKNRNKLETAKRKMTQQAPIVALSNNA